MPYNTLVCKCVFNAQVVEIWSEKNAWRKVGLYGTIIIIMLSGVKKGENFHCSGVRERYNHISL